MHASVKTAEIPNNIFTSDDSDDVSSSLIVFFLMPCFDSYYYVKKNCYCLRLHLTTSFVSFEPS